MNIHRIFKELFYNFTICFCLTVEVILQAAPCFLEDFSRHELRAAFRNNRREFHLIENIFLKIDARSDLRQKQTIRSRFRDSITSLPSATALRAEKEDCLI